MVRNLPSNEGDIRGMGSITGSGTSPGGGRGNPPFLPGESHGQRSLEGHSLQGCRKSDMTEAT